MMINYIKRTIVGCVLLTAMLLVGCSNNATREQMQQLDEVRSHISALQSQVDAKKKDKSDLQKQIDERNQKLKQCQDDQQAVKKALKKE